MDLSTTYLGLELKNPIIAGSCGLTSTAAEISRLQQNGVAAVVLKSIFEEQILNEANHLKNQAPEHSEAMDYISGYTRQHSLGNYLQLIEEAKKTGIPVIASVNCISAAEWTSFATQIQNAGADALELNLFLLPADIHQKGTEVEQVYLDIINNVTDKVDIPVSVKLSPYFSGLANTVFNLSLRNVRGFVLFNRFSRPDIDLNKMEITSADVFSCEHENSPVLRWIGLLSERIKADLVATSGIHSGRTVIKNLLAGARAVQVASVLYQKGPEYVQTMLEEIREWMKSHNFSSVKEFTGKLSYSRTDNPQIYERAQFMRFFSDRKN